MREIWLRCWKCLPSCSDEGIVQCRQSQLERLEAERDSLRQRVSDLEAEKASRVDEVALSVLREKAAAMEQSSREAALRNTELERKGMQLEEENRQISSQCVEMQR